MHLFLGSKGPSKSQDVPDLKPLPPLKPLSGSASKKTATNLPDRKRDCPSPLQPLRLAKQRKTASPHSPSVSIDIESSLKTSSSPVPSVAPIDGKYFMYYAHIRQSLKFPTNCADLRKVGGGGWLFYIGLLDSVIQLSNNWPQNFVEIVKKTLKRRP